MGTSWNAATRKFYFGENCIEGRKKKLIWVTIIMLIGFICAALPISANAETVFVKYRGQVDLAPFTCESTQRSSMVKRLCYDAKDKYVVVNLSGTYYHYCEVPKNIVSDWLRAESMGRYYNQYIKGRYDCRALHVPQYGK
jgi:hypothetical protein